jgi:hypothetical protein
MEHKVRLLTSLLPSRPQSTVVNTPSYLKKSQEIQTPSIVVPKPVVSKVPQIVATDEYTKIEEPKSLSTSYPKLPLTSFRSWQR